MFLCKLEERFIHTLLFSCGVPVQFNVKIFPEYFVPAHKSFFGLSFTNMQNQIRYFTIEATGGSNQPFFILLYKFSIDARINAIQAFSKSYGTQFGKVQITDFIFCNQYLVEP